MSTFAKISAVISIFDLVHAPIIQQPDSLVVPSGNFSPVAMPDTVAKTSKHTQVETLPVQDTTKKKVGSKIKTDSAGNPLKDTFAIKNAKKPDSVQTVPPDTTSKHTEPELKEGVNNLPRQQPSLIDLYTENHIRKTFDADSVPFIFKPLPGDELFEQNFLFRQNICGPQDNTDTIAEPLAQIQVSLKTDTPKVFQAVQLPDNVNYDLNTTTDWMIGIMLGSLVIVAWIKLIYSKLLAEMVASTVNYQTAGKMFRESSAVYKRISFILNGLFIFNLSLALYLVLNYYGITIMELNPFSTYCALFGIMLSIYIGKFLVYNIFGSIFNARPETAEYIHNVFINNKVLGLFLIPFNIAIPYVPDYLTPILINSAMVLFGIFFLSRIIRGIQISMKISFSIFYLILYLCTLEILPMLVLIKVFRSSL